MHRINESTVCCANKSFQVVGGFQPDLVAGVRYYDNLSIENALNGQPLLAYEMSYEPLDHLYGDPSRLRVENQLGFKMVKWIKAEDI